MSIKSWLNKNGRSLEGKTVLITGATGGLGSAACRYLLQSGAAIVMVNRSKEKTDGLCTALKAEYPKAQITCYFADLSDITQVKSLCTQLQTLSLDAMILNAGTYAVPREKCSTGWDVVFQTNFLSHYFMVKQLLPALSQNHGKVVAVGSLAHDFIVTDPEDPDWSSHEGDNKIYGNSKRYLMYALTELLKDWPHVEFAIGHPGICFTGITSNYPKNILPVVKVSMKILFMWPPMAVRSIVKALFAPVPPLHWVGPRFFNIWGNPSIQPLPPCEEAERTDIFQKAEAMYEDLLKM